MAVKAANFIKKKGSAKKKDNPMLAWIGKRRGNKKSAKGSDDEE